MARNARQKRKHAKREKHRAHNRRFALKREDIARRFTREVPTCPKCETTNVEEYAPGKYVHRDCPQFYDDVYFEPVEEPVTCGLPDADVF